VDVIFYAYFKGLGPKVEGEKHKEEKCLLHQRFILISFLLSREKVKLKTN
jgi:hypothetical protein